MRLLIEIAEKDYLYINKHGIMRPPHIVDLSNAVKNGQPLPENTMILDKDKLERDADYDAYYDGYTAYSQIALEAAEIKEQTE